MSGYTKLFSSLIHSTIWREKNHVRIVWVTMLAMADRDGVVHASIPGLADAARVTLKECNEALDVLRSPDPYSRTKDEDGRRIKDLDGGWFLITHGKHMDLMSADDRREKARIRQQRKRERDRLSRSESRSVTRCNSSNDTVSVSISSSKGVGGAGEEGGQVKPIPPGLGGNPRKDPRVLRIRDAWMRAFRIPRHEFRSGLFDADADAIADAVNAYGVDDCLLALEHAPTERGVLGKLDGSGELHNSLQYLFGNQATLPRLLAHAARCERETTHTSESPSDMIARLKAR